MNNTNLWLLVAVIVVVIIGIGAFVYVEKNRAKLVKSGEFGKAVVETVERLAEAAVHQVDGLDLDNAAKKAEAVAFVKGTANDLGITNLNDAYISGAIELAVSAMHLAYNKVALDNKQAADISIKKPE